MPRHSGIFPSRFLGRCLLGLVVIALTLPSAGRSALAAPVILNYLAIQTSNNAMLPIAARFNATHPNIKVVVNQLPFDQLFQQLQVRLSSGTSNFDLLDVDAPVVAAYTVQGFLAPLDQYFSKADLAQFVPATLNTGYYNGHLLAPPLNSSSQILYYNKDLLKKAGVSFPPNDPTKRLTWEQLAAEAQKAQVKSGSQVTAWGFVIDQIDRPYQLLPLPESLGGQPISKDGLHVSGIINSPAWIKAFTFYSNLFNTWGISPKSATPSQTPNLFASGHAAFFWGGPWNATTFTAAKNLNWGFAPTPYFAGGKPVTPNDSWHLGINAHSKNTAAAAQFIHWVTVGPGADMWQIAINQTPSLKRWAAKIQTDPAFAKYPGSVLRLCAYEAIHTAIARPVTPGFSEYQDILTQAFDNIRSGQAPKAALDAAASQIDRAMVKYSR
ncbi:MAG TPA: sugar ABC transporter substrate-binding protein [Chloroflexota bacterium]|nr:sugar ABC transporter substrate-binding protein [Chloroflexota bacterium]